jgi:hypothetical protein
MQSCRVGVRRRIRHLHGEEDVDDIGELAEITVRLLGDAAEAVWTVLTWIMSRSAAALVLRSAAT